MLTCPISFLKKLLCNSTIFCTKYTISDKSIFSIFSIAKFSSKCVIWNCHNFYYTCRCRVNIVHSYLFTYTNLFRHSLSSAMVYFLSNIMPTPSSQVFFGLPLLILPALFASCIILTGRSHFILFRSPNLKYWHAYTPLRTGCTFSSCMTISFLIMSRFVMPSTLHKYLISIL